jgi:hypothetical protein
LTFLTSCTPVATLASALPTFPTLSSNR